jgi:hypothetical protein
VQTVAKVLVNFALVTIGVVLPLGAIVQGYSRLGWVKASLKLVLPLVLAVPLGLWLEVQGFLTAIDIVLLVMMFVVIMGFVTKLDTG